MELKLRKVLIVLLLCGLVVFGFTGCGSKESDKAEGEVVAMSATQAVKTESFFHFNEKTGQNEFYFDDYLDEFAASGIEFTREPTLSGVTNRGSVKLGFNIGRNKLYILSLKLDTDVEPTVTQIVLETENDVYLFGYFDIEGVGKNEQVDVSKATEVVTCVVSNFGEKRYIQIEKHAFDDLDKLLKSGTLAKTDLDGSPISGFPYLKLSHTNTWELVGK